MIVPLLSVAYVGLVLYNVFVTQGTPIGILYAYHPICASLFIVFASLGLNAAQAIRGSKYVTRAQREPLVQQHAIFNWLALFSLVGAGATIYLNKERANKPHLTTYHGQAGAATAVFFLLNVFGGGAMNTVPALYKYIKMHRLFGLVLYTGLLAAHGTAVWRGYAGFKGEDEVMGKYALLALLGLMWVVTLSRVQLSGLPGGKSAPKAKTN